MDSGFHFASASDRRPSVGPEPQLLVPQCPPTYQSPPSGTGSSQASPEQPPVIMSYRPVSTINATDAPPRDVHCPTVVSSSLRESLSRPIVASTCCTSLQPPPSSPKHSHRPHHSNDLRQESRHSKRDWCTAHYNLPPLPSCPPSGLFPTLSRLRGSWTDAAEQ
ncbi:unnamed protein product, partial [Protopolystoma xenopodis]